MEIILLVILAIVIALLLAIYFSLSPDKAETPTDDHPFVDPIMIDADDKSGRLTPCPLCETMLKRGEKVHSVVYPGKADRLVEIYGCPYCYPQKDSPVRRCPSCKRILDPDDLIYARMFHPNGRTKKPHIHVNGCSVCMKKR